MKHQKVIQQDLGRMSFREAWDYQESLLRENVTRKAQQAAGENSPGPAPYLGTEHYLLWVEHPPVYTLGKNGKMEHVLLGEEELHQRGIDFFRINRGGDITFHGPGQIVGYPILDLEKFETDIGKYLRRLEEVVIRTLADYGISAGRSAGETGVWIDADIKGRERKICAIGIRCSRWVTMHGFAFNINTDLRYFDHIIPCGIKDKSVTSLARELGRDVDMEEVKNILVKHFADVFAVEMVPKKENQKSLAR